MPGKSSTFAPVMKKDIINRKMIALALASSVAPISLWAGTSNVLSLDNNKVDNTDFKVFTDSSKVFDIDEVLWFHNRKRTFAFAAITQQYFCWWISDTETRHPRFARAF